MERGEQQVRGPEQPARGAQDLRETLVRDGYAVVPDVLDQTMLARVCDITERMISREDPAELAEQRTTGSMISVTEEPALAELAAWPATIATFEALGFGELAWMGGYVITKPPRSPRLFWHQDWMFWNDASSFSDIPLQVAVMYYLTDTDVSNGCLRVIPGSHRRRHWLHAHLGAAHTPELRRGEVSDHPGFSTVDDEVDVPVRAGDLVLADARLLHAAHENTTDMSRPLITLWYWPSWDVAPDHIRSAMGGGGSSWLDAWPQPERDLVADLLPKYDATVPAQKLEISRIPGPDFL